MRILLCAVNAKYIHSNLAVLYLREAALADGRECMVREFSINEPPGYILSELHQYRPQVAGFSCYIWNIELVLKLCADLKKTNPECIVVLGGPEVSYSAGKTLAGNPAVDYIVSGEGEEIWPQLLSALEADGNPVLPGVYGRAALEAHSMPKFLSVGNLDELPFPYRGVTQMENRIVYYESSRGCPFKCSYCISSLDSGVRFLPLSRVKNELQHLNGLQPKEIKFVDRTFNCDQSRARAIMESIAQLPGTTRFHMEISPQLLNEAFLEFLEGLPPDRFAFEIGVQSTHGPTLKAVRRSGAWDRISASILRIAQAGNIHLHLDLIAALPEEDYATFEISFNKTYGLKPHHLQLGFLKMLPGTEVRREAEAGRYCYQQHPPYEVLSNCWLSYEELVRLHHIEDVLERYYNAGLAEHTVEEVVNAYYGGNAFAFWQALGDYWHEHGYYGIGVGRTERISILKHYLDQVKPSNRHWHHELLKYDVLKDQAAYTLPEGLENTPGTAETLHSLLKRDGFLEQYLPEYRSQSMQNIKKRIILERFEYLPQTQGSKIVYVLFVYRQKGRPASRVAEIDPSWLE